MKILLVEDEAEFAEWLIKGLMQSEFQIEWANDGIVAEKILGLDEFDAVILDLNLPGKNGLNILKTLRSTGKSVPVIVVTTCDSISDRVCCLREGADDIVTKHVALEELEARLFALLRRSRGKASPFFYCGPLSYNPHTKQFRIEANPLSLTKKERAILGALIQHPNQPVSKSYLFDRVYSQSDDVSFEAVEVAIYRLRKKIQGSTINIATVRGYGYCLECRAT